VPGKQYPSPSVGIVSLNMDTLESLSESEYLGEASGELTLLDESPELSLALMLSESLASPNKIKR